MRETRYIVANDEQGYTRLIGQNEKGVFDIVVDKVKTGGNKHQALNYFEQKHPEVTGRCI